MTKETFNKAVYINHDITSLKEIKSEQDKNHWVGFRTPTNDIESFWNPEIMNDFKEFVEKELEKVEKMFSDI